MTIQLADPNITFTGTGIRARFDPPVSLAEAMFQLQQASYRRLIFNLRKHSAKLREEKRQVK